MNIMFIVYSLYDNSTNVYAVLINCMKKLPIVVATINKSINFCEFVTSMKSP